MKIHKAIPSDAPTIQKLSKETWSDTSFNVLYTIDLVKTHDFYKALGAEIKKYENDKVVVEIGSFDLHFILNTTEPFDAYKYIANTNDRGAGVIFYIETNNIKGVYELTPQAGGILKSEIFENMWGYQELLLEDPNGYKFAIYQEIQK